MKKIVELEERWKVYRYRVAIFYLFIAILLVFLVFLGFFIKFQYDRHFAKAPVQSAPLAAPESQVVIPPIVEEVAQIEETSSLERINFVCRKVTAEKLTVRSRASFRSEPVGYYGRDSIFCTNNENVNGLLQTSHGWISAHDAYSHEVEVNMFVDSGFYKYQPVARNNIEEVRVFQDTPEVAQIPQMASVQGMPTQYNASQNDMAQSKEPVSRAQEPISREPVARKESGGRPVINITSETITKEREIELKKADFRTTNKYETAIEIAEYYYNLKDYENSIKWALNASSAESRGKLKTDSWIIYSKSLYASGNKEQAMEVLNRYISNTQSRDAIDVLNKMKNGII